MSYIAQVETLLNTGPDKACDEQESAAASSVQEENLLQWHSDMEICSLSQKIPHDFRCDNTNLSISDEDIIPLGLREPLPPFTLIAEL